MLLLYVAYISHDEHGHARSSLRERNACDDSGSRGLFHTLSKDTLASDA